MIDEKAKDIFLARADCYIGDFPQEPIDDFCGYWTELVTYKGELMFRFQTQFTFDLHRRLVSFRDNGAPGKTAAQLQDAGTDYGRAATAL